LFDEDLEPEWVEVDTRRVRVERTRDFGASRIALQIMRKLGLLEFLREILPAGREEVPWSLMALVLVIFRLCDPSSELYIAAHLYERTALSDLLGVPAVTGAGKRRPALPSVGCAAPAQGAVGAVSEGAARRDVRPGG
ncbi:MAG TPA: hypothetical protein VGS41_04955, partial [Chthonomonadales bacterium]|nr:hypothetical protein [Chthonomonadales bacterium]